MRRLSRWIPASGGALVAGAAALAITGCGSSSDHTVTRTVTSTSAAAATSEPAAFSSGGGMTINQIYKKAGPGVVDIVVTSAGSGGGNSLFGGGGTQKDEGAGVVYNDQGYILTDQHVVANAKSIRVTFQDGRVATAKLIGTDPSTDVGVIKVDVPQSELHPLPFADSGTAQVGDAVVAIGSPFSLPETVTSGIVSQTGRSIQAPNNYTIPGAIQTDAAINPGNSGGPLLNANGDVLGLNDQIDTNNTAVGGEGSNSGIGFATPGNEVQKVADTLIAGKKLQHSYVGVFLASASEGGARVASQQANGQPPIAPGSPADKAGLKPGDLITAVDGTTITSTNQFIATVFQDDPGQTITLTVKRDGQTMQLKVTLGTRPASAPGG